MKTKVIIAMIALMSQTVHAGILSSINHWIKTEVKPTLRGDRPLKIDPKRISIVQHGKPILKYEGDSLYVKAAGVTFQTSKLRQRIAEAGAIYSGDYTVLAKVASEQFDKELKKAVENQEITVSEMPPEITTQVENSTLPPTECVGKNVVISNQLPITLRYAMADATYEISAGESQMHCESNGKFFLQFDEDISDDVKIGRYYLTSDKYRLFINQYSNQIRIIKY